MTQGRPMGLLFAFALPLMFGNVFQQLYTVAVADGILGSEYGIFAAAVSAWCGDTLYLAISYYRTLRKKHQDI